MSVKIDANVPVPDKPDVQADKFPLASLEVGQSFEFPYVDRKYVQSMASTIKRRKGLEYTVKKINEQTARVWRTS